MVVTETIIEVLNLLKLVCANHLGLTNGYPRVSG